MSFALKIYANRNVSELYRYHDGVTFHDEGIDLIFPDDVIIPSRAGNFAINMKIRISILDTDTHEGIPCVTVAKSNIFWTPLKVSQIKISDGDVIVFVDNWEDHEFKIKRGQIFTQILSVKPGSIFVTVCYCDAKL